MSENLPAVIDPPAPADEKPKRDRKPRPPKPARQVCSHPEAKRIREHANATTARVDAALEHLPERDSRRVAFRQDAAHLDGAVERHDELIAKREAAIAAHTEAMRLLGLEIDDARSWVGQFEKRVDLLAPATVRGQQAR